MVPQILKRPHALSFAASGFLMYYQLGVVRALKELAPEMINSLSRVYGSSGGALVAAVITCDGDLDAFQECLFKAVEDSRRSFWGPFSPFVGVFRTLKEGLIKNLSENSHQKASGKLYLSLTRVSNLQNVMVSEYKSKEDLIEALMCSCFIPGYGGLIPPTYRGVRYMDGGFTNMQPCHDVEGVISISPFTGEIDICPRDSQALFSIVNIFGTTIQLSMGNFSRAFHAGFPPTITVMERYHSLGYQNAISFLLMTRDMKKSITKISCSNSTSPIKKRRCFKC
nr:PREDICTED: patatin-like phospholipase domain-containing protein 1 isoform X2 [Anolis carolinensis]|eukprot:XP_016848817.1 PREDICTED: patatin-like phospholipase domain-containing protein 1 isoform X2 [Anolis carolinensis]